MLQLWALFSVTLWRILIAFMHLLKSNPTAPNQKVLTSWYGHFNLGLIGLKASSVALENKMQICNESVVIKDNHQRSATSLALHTNNLWHLAKPIAVFE